MKKRHYQMISSPSKPHSPQPVRRTALNRQHLSVQMQDNDSLSSSLPTALSKEQFKHLKKMEKVGMPQTLCLSTEDLQDHLTIQSSSLESFRQRSLSTISLNRASLSTISLNRASLSDTSHSRTRHGSFRRSIMGFSRSHSSSGRFVHTKSTKQSSEVAPHPNQDTSVQVHKVDATILKIRKQLKQFSDEDCDIHDRINRLMSDITNLMKVKKIQSLYSSSLSQKSQRVDMCTLNGGKVNIPSRQLADEQKECMLVASVDRNTTSCIGEGVLSDVEELWQEESLLTMNKNPLLSSCESQDVCESTNLKGQPKVSETEYAFCKIPKSAVSEAREEKLLIATNVPTLVISDAEDDTAQSQ